MGRKGPGTGAPKARRPRTRRAPVPQQGMLRQVGTVFQVLLENTSVVFYATDAQGHLTYVSPSIEQITGAIPGEIRGRHFSEFIHPQDLPHLQRQYEKLAQGILELDEYRLLTRDGGTRWVLSSSKPVFDRRKMFTGVVGVLTDVHRGHTAEEAFRETDEQFRTTFDLAGVGIAHLAPDWTWLRANVTLCEIIGYPLQDLLTMRFPDITHQHDRAADIASLDRLAQGMIQAVTKEKRVLRKDGFMISVNCTVSALRAPDGAIKYYIAIVEDITGRKRMEDTLQLLRTAVESIPLGLTITNLDGRIVYVNPAEALMHGYHPDELLGKEARILAPAQQWSTHSLKDLVDRNVISDAPYAREGYNVRKDGVAFPISIRSVPVRDLRGAPLGIVSVTEDITDRKKMLDALQESEQKYRTLFESANDAIFITDHATGILTDCNVRACELVGSTRDEIISMHQGRLHPPEEAEQYRQQFASITVDQPTAMFNDQIVCRKDGTRVWVDISATLFEMRGTLSVIGIFREVTARKKAEEQFVQWVGQLRESEERYRTLVTNISGVVYRCEPAAPWKVDYISDAVLSLSGYPARDFLEGRRHRRELIVREDTLRVDRTMEEAIAGDRPFAIEYRIMHADGTVRWVYEKGRAVRNPSGDPLWMDGVILDITERKLAEEGKQKAERRYRSLVDNSLVGIFISTVGGELLYVNDAHARLAGYDSPGELMRVNAEGLYKNSSDRQRLIEALRRDGQVSNFEFEHLRKDGSTMVVHISASLDGDTISGMMMDVTDRRKAEDAIASAKRDWESTFDTITDMITIHDEEFNIVRSNRAAADMLGLPWAQMGRAKCYSYYHGTDCPPANCPSCESLRTGQSSVEERYEPHLGKYLEIRAIPRVDDSGRVRGLIHVVRDITERKRAEEERLRLEARLRDAEKLEVIGSLAGGVAHEVRNPLNAIMALTDALDREVGGNPEYHTYMHHMRTQVERLSALMTDLLELGKPVDRSRLRTERLFEICMLSLDAWKQSKWGRGRDVELVGLPLGQDLQLEADGKKLQQVFINLLDNAAQHSADGSPLTMEVLKGNGGTAQVRIIDRGSGIPEDMLPKVFDTFFTTRRGGTGLGLSIVKHIVEIHGGAITISNNESPPGCTATVILPVKEATAE